MKRNNTKRTLVLSLISILLCFTMLIGSTFAWFTDTASTAVNKIQSGTLDIVLEYQDGDDWKNAEGETLAWNRACENGTGLWEPGCTYLLPAIRVRNNGNLSLKYKIYINGIRGDAKLNEAINWTIKIGEEDFPLEGFEGVLLPEGVTGHDDNNNELPSGSTGSLVISGHMREEAGNEYQGLTIDGIGITVVATQYAWECDSDGHDYDAEAAYPTLVNTTEGLTEALNNGGSVALQGDVESNNGDTFSVMEDTNLDFNGNTLKGMIESGCYDSEGNHKPINLVLSDSQTDDTSFSIDGQIKWVGSGQKQAAAISATWAPTITIESGRYRHNSIVLRCKLQNPTSQKGIIVNGGYFEATSGVCIEVTAGEIVINNGEFVSGTYHNNFLISLGATKQSIPSVITINGGEFTAREGQACFGVEKKEGYEQHIYITGGTFNLAEGLGNEENLTGILVITGGTFNVDPTAYVDTENYTVTESEGTWTVTAK